MNKNTPYVLSGLKRLSASSAIRTNKTQLAFEAALRHESQTPFGFIGYSDEALRLAYTELRKGVSQTPFGFIGYSDAGRAGDELADRGAVSNTFRLHRLFGPVAPTAAPATAPARLKRLSASSAIRT